VPIRIAPLFRAIAKTVAIALLCTEDGLFVPWAERRVTRELHFPEWGDHMHPAGWTVR
jgi:hypothetical protein